MEKAIEHLKSNVHLKLVCPETIHYALIFPAQHTAPFVYGASDSLTYFNATTRHAEISVLQKIRHKTNLPHSIDFLVVRFSKTGERGNARPCRHCIQHMRNFTGTRIRNVYYTDQHGNIVQEKMRNLASGYTCSGMRRRNKMQQREL